MTSAVRVINSLNEPVPVENNPTQSTFKITNLPAATANTEVSHLLNQNTRVLYFRPNKDAIMKFAFTVNGTVTGPFITVPSGQGFTIDDMRSPNNLVLYVQTDKANNVIEILERG